MKFQTLLITAILVHPALAFVVPLEWDEKCKKADAIVRGVVIDVVPLTKQVEDSGGFTSEKNSDEDFTGPHAVALVRVTEILKGEATDLAGVIFVPCGYDFDESPAELTKTKEYALFLEKMGHNYFHPLDPFSMHRVQMGRVGNSGFDTASDFDAGKKAVESMTCEEFAKRVRRALGTADRAEPALEESP